MYKCFLSRNRLSYPMSVEYLQTVEYFMQDSKQKGLKCAAIPIVVKQQRTGCRCFKLNACNAACPKKHTHTLELKPGSGLQNHYQSLRKGFLFWPNYLEASRDSHHALKMPSLYTRITVAGWTSTGLLRSGYPTYSTVPDPMGRVKVGNSKTDFVPLNWWESTNNQPETRKENSVNCEPCGGTTWTSQIIKYTK